MKITKRIAEAQYCFTEVVFDSLEEYNTMYKPFLQGYQDVSKPLNAIADKLAAKQAIINK